MVMMEVTNSNLWLFACVLLFAMVASKVQATTISEVLTNPEVSTTPEVSTILDTVDTASTAYSACHSNPCLNGGTCVDYWHSPGYYYCHCDWNFSGHNCEYYVPTIPEVSTTPAISTTTSGQCASDQFQCANGYECIYGYWYCDVIVDCSDGSDEYNCHGSTPGYTSTSSYQNFPVRLVAGGWCEGRVEVFYGGSWGTVCDDNWDMHDAEVVCRQLGCGHAVSALREAHYGQGSGPIWLDGISCSGYESELSHCKHHGWGSHDCSHSEDSSVVCSHAASASTTVNYWSTTPSYNLSKQFHCDSHSMELLIPLSEISSRGLSVYDIHLQDPLCHAIVYGQYARLLAPLNGCGSRTETNGDTIIYINTAYGYVAPNGAKRLRVPMLCYMGSSGRVQASFTPRVQDMVSTGSYELQVHFYTNQFFHQPVYSYPYDVELGNPLYAEVTLTSVAWDLQLFLETCKVSPYPGAPDSASFFLLQNGCHVDPTYTTYYSGSNNKQRFSFVSVEFFVDSQVYLECSVRVCNVSDWGSRCRRGCMRGGRVARDLGTVHGDARHAEHSVDLSQGPIRLRKTREASLEKQGSDGLPGWTGMVYALAATMAVGAVCVTTVKIYRHRAARIQYQPLSTSY